MKFYIIAGEKSGDQHGAGVAEQLLQIDGESVVRGVGGDAMTTAGVSLLFHFREIGIMGFTEIISQLFKLNQLMNLCQQDLISFQPDALILIDSAGFNLRMAKFASKQNLKVFYFIPPKVWAWGRWRMTSMKKYINHIFVTLPFEYSFFNDNGFDVTYHGSPIKARIDSMKEVKEASDDDDSSRKQVALLPGSRNQEVSSHMEVMLDVAREHLEHDFIVCAVSSVPKDVYNESSFPENTSIVFDLTDEVLPLSTAAIVASGTATLETCLFGVPQVVVYKTGWLNYWIARFFIQLKFISLVNLIADKRVVNEFVQKNCNKKSIGDELTSLVNDINHRNSMLTAYEEIAKQLPKQNTYQKIAIDVVELSGLEFAQT